MRYWGSTIFNRATSGDERPAMARVLLCDAGQHIQTLVVTPREFTATVAVQRFCDDYDADLDLVERALDVAWRGCAPAELDAIIERERAERRAAHRLK